MENVKLTFKSTDWFDPNELIIAMPENLYLSKVRFSFDEEPRKLNNGSKKIKKKKKCKK